MKVYFISGLGADKKAFYKIKLPAGYEPVYLDWIPPLKNESLPDYARRFSSGINPPESPDKNFILIGLSFGGMLVSEIAKITHPEKIIIISSISCYKELPWYFKLAGKLRLNRIIPPGFYKQATLLNRFMGAGDKEMKAIVYSYVKNTDPEFIRWSLNEILNWQHAERIPKLVHIHGSRDHLLPHRFTNADHIIKKAGHLMVLNRADEVNAILKQVLQGNEIST